MTSQFGFGDVSGCGALAWRWAEAHPTAGPSSGLALLWDMRLAWDGVDFAACWFCQEGIAEGHLQKVVNREKLHSCNFTRYNLKRKNAVGHASFVFGT